MKYSIRLIDQALDDVFNVEEEDLDLEKINNEVDEELMEEAQKFYANLITPSSMMYRNKIKEQLEKNIDEFEKVLESVCI